MPSPSSAPDEVTDTAEITKPIQIRRSAVLPMAIVSAFSVKSPMSLAGKSAHMIVPVSYTHLDVYKRQVLGGAIAKMRKLSDNTEITGFFTPTSNSGHQGSKMASLYNCLLYTSRCV